MSSLSTFDALVADLTRDVHRVQPKDALQFCANWFQSRLEEQRTRTRDALSHRPSLATSLPTDHYVDTPLSPSAGPISSNGVSPFAQPFRSQRSSMRDSVSNNSPFGTLNVPGNALLSDSSTSSSGRDHTTSPPTFRFEGASLPPSSPLSDNPNPFASFSNGPISPVGEYLHPPTSTILARRTSVSAESIALDAESDEPLPVFPKTDDQLRRIRESIKDLFLFRDLDPEQERGALNAMREVRVGEDELVIRQGDVGDYFYIVEEGLLHIFKYPGKLPEDWLTGRGPFPQFTEPGFHPTFGQRVQVCEKGSSFGELALMYGHPRAASVLAIEPSTLWSLDRITFRTIILKHAYKRRTMYEQFLSSVDLLTSLEPAERSKIADALESRVFEDGDAVVRQGEMGDTFFFVEEGEAEVTKRQRGDDGDIREVTVGHLTKGDYFGELSLLRLEPRAATVSAMNRTDPSKPRLKVAALEANAFTRLLGPLREIMERNAGQNYGPVTRGSR
ncbi:protein kinase A regulatory subunit [Obba rivulosa]|uniref:cAMP-dependent protein kinase regulatory subunit n=1 Tax=Obba rivulosa TaxID=1052685 RepID=A0A8E2AUT9_9APHY|nr:protein kinase A regulatory subunit [Obba rivulosa]